MGNIGDEVQFLDDSNVRTGTIEQISGQSVSICGLDGTLYITSVDNILFKLTY